MSASATQGGHNKQQYYAHLHLSKNATTILYHEIYTTLNHRLDQKVSQICFMAMMLICNKTEIY